MKAYLSFLLLSILISFGGFAQSNENIKKNAQVDSGFASDSLSEKPLQFNRVAMKKRVGLFTVYTNQNKTYFGIPDSILGRDILVHSRLKKGSAEKRRAQSIRGFAGDQINETVVRLEKGPNQHIFIREMFYNERSINEQQDMFENVMNSNLPPIVMSFPIAQCYNDSNPAGKSSIIDITDEINNDNNLFFFGSTQRKDFKIGTYHAERSYLLGIETFPMNTVIKTVKTYSQLADATADDQPTLTFELNTSFFLLPEKPMPMRFSNERIGYFSRSFTDFDSNPQGIKDRSIILRWRLEPKKEDIEEFRKGKLVEPQKPIIIYIDPSTPSRWVPYFIQAIDDWQPAFEKAGFKNAIYGKKSPSKEEDPNWDINDGRYSVLQYKPSSERNAGGNVITDPRSGEIISAHIDWSHNVMSALHNMYMIQTSAIDPRARKMNFDDDLMGRLVRYMCAHEVGHILGLTHNFLASTAISTAQLRNKTWLNQNSLSTSVMDYSRFNYVAQPEDSVNVSSLIPRVSDYDMWAIEWGYKIIQNPSSPEQQGAILNQLIDKKIADKRFLYGTESNQDDPRMQGGDIGDDAMASSTFGIENLKRILPNLVGWTKSETESANDLESIYKELVNQFILYTGHVSKNIGGCYDFTKGQKGPDAVYKIVPASVQQRAMNFLNDQVFATPEWILDNRIFKLTGIAPTTVIEIIQRRALNDLLNESKLKKLLRSASVGGESFQISNMFSKLHEGIWNELSSKGSISVYRRNLQKIYVQNMIEILQRSLASSESFERIEDWKNLEEAIDPKTTDICSVVKADLLSISKEIRISLPAVKDSMTIIHLKDVLSRIERQLIDKSISDHRE